MTSIYKKTFRKVDFEQKKDLWVAPKYIVFSFKGMVDWLSFVKYNFGDGLKSILQGVALYSKRINIKAY
jgi:hypothetical protein